MSERAPRPPWPEFRAALDSVGYRPSRRLGQCFLLDENAARAIARDAAVGEGDVVLEVGPGCGFLSVHLAHAGARLHAVEIDPRLAAIAERFLAPYPGARVAVGDALAGKHRLGPAFLEGLPPPGVPWRLVANLPYSISAPLLALVAALEPPPAAAVVLVQEEVAQRLAARPATPDWGPLSVAVQACFAVELGRRLGPDLFWPRPRVESRLVHLDPRPDRSDALGRERVVALARRLLLHRRKTLGRVLGDLLGDRGGAETILTAGGWSAAQRAEELGIDEWTRLERRVAER